MSFASLKIIFKLSVDFSERYIFFIQHVQLTVALLYLIDSYIQQSFCLLNVYYSIVVFHDLRLH